MQIRKAHSVEIIDKRLRDAEVSCGADAMELVGLHDELSRVERKWMLKREEPHRDGPRKRPPADPAAMNQRFDRLRRLIDAAVRRSAAAPAELDLLRQIATILGGRKPLPQAE